MPFDSAKNIMTISAEMENSLGLFAQYNNFTEARLFRLRDNTFILEITMGAADKLNRERVPMDANAVDSLRRRITDFQNSGAILDQTARSKFLASEIFLCLTDGILLTVELQATGRAAAGLPLLIGGGGFLAWYVGTQNASLTDAQSSLGLNGAYFGLVHGALLDVLLTNGHTGREMCALMTATSVGETIAGLEIANDNHLTEGQTDIIGSCGLLGAGQGAGLAYLLSPNAGATTYAGLALAGSAVGYAAGVGLANDNSAYTHGDANVVTTAGMFGALSLGMLALSMAGNSSSSSQAFVLAAMAGNLGGVAISHLSLRDQQLSTSDGNYIELGTFAGCLIGSGIGYMIGSNQGTFSTLGFTIPMVPGTAAGFGITYNAFAHHDDQKISGNFNIQANPVGLIGATLRQSPEQMNANVPPALSLCYKW